MKTFKKGERVKIFNQTDGGTRFLEGIAVIERKADFGETFYNVKFENDGYRCERNLFEAERV